MQRSRAKLSRLLDDVADRDGFVAVGAWAAEAEAGAGGVAVVAPLLAEVAGVAVWALVDGDGSPAGGRRDDGGGRAGLRVAGAPGGLAAGGGAVALAADRGERLPAGGAGCGCALPSECRPEPLKVVCPPPEGVWFTRRPAPPPRR